MAKLGYGKLKGSRNERRLCRALSLLVSNGERDDLLWRSAMSGGVATVALRGGKARATQAGDVSSIDPESHWLVREWYIEAKHYGDLQILRGFTHNGGKLAKFWFKTVEEARHYHKKPMLLAKQDRLPELVIVKMGTRIGDMLANPILLVPAWNAEVYLFPALANLTPRPRRVLIEE